MGIFSSMESAKVTGGGVYFLPGRYKVAIDRVKMQKSQRNARDYVIIETTIIESDNKERPPSCQCSQVLDFSNQMGPINFKAFISAASGIDPEDPEVNEKLSATWTEMIGETLNLEQICEMVVSDQDNPLQGLELNLECREITTRSGSPFTKHFWKKVQ